jgi:hypothetical protein
MHARRNDERADRQIKSSTYSGRSDGLESVRIDEASACLRRRGSIGNIRRKEETKEDD